MKQAIVILHGMGEQIPMQTLEGFVKSVWTSDETLVSRDKPDPETGAVRSRNTAWAKPDNRNLTYELRRITTESAADRRITDFYEYYWADLMHGTTWAQVQAWIAGLLWRNPWSRVPPRLIAVWVVLWIVTLVTLGLTIWGMWPRESGPIGPLWAVGSGIGGLALSAFIANVMVKRFGDVARYVKAAPPNVARRQEIRRHGVELLDSLIASKSGDKPEYDRIIVVAHSLGTIVAYDILTQLFARHNKTLAAPAAQPERQALEQMIQVAAGLPTTRDTAAANPVPLDIDAFQAQQARALAEARAQGSDWRVTDFVTLGSPLTHAEFLLADSPQDLLDRQSTRVLPICPPVLEYDGITKLRHFSYRTDSAPKDGPDHWRLPHHAALFAYTRWTNLYSDHRAILWGDVISGPVGRAFGLTNGKVVVSGIRDIAVLPALDAKGNPVTGMRRRIFTHNSYWQLDKGTEFGKPVVPHHIVQLRRALRLLD